MKKTLLFISLFLSFASNAQEVSPYYPAKGNFKSPYYFTSQFSYFDLNYISNNISEFLTYRLNMVINKDDSSKLLKDGGTYSVNYVERISTSGKERLNFIYTVGLVDNVYTIKTVKITGTKESLISFFVEFWQTTMNFQEPSGKSDVSLLTGQDVVKYYVNKGNPYITITNNTFKDLEDFKKYFIDLKAKQQL